MDIRYRKIRNIMILILFLNLAVSVAKISYGMLTNTLSMQSDGYHSLFDGVSNIVGIVGIQVACKPPDAEHPYGHRKFETLASIFIAVLLISVAFKIVSSAFSRFGSNDVPEVTLISFLIMIGTMIVNYFVTTYEYRSGKKLQSEVLIADSMHTKSDIYVSLSVIVGLIAIKAGFPILDPLIAVVIAGVIIHAGYSIIKQSASVLCDQSQLDPEDICKVAYSVEGVLQCTTIRTRGVAGNIFMDMRLGVRHDISITESHTISHLVENKLKEHFDGVQDVVIHIEPVSIESAS
ncbi:MAG: ferrous iron efflux protein F [Methanomethylovorans sp. PtaU1.Bin093]|uniref:cation diffusion facilitator family transporter n=2 Tax=Methanomethylovorans TaxID=101191 RepID=UPI0009CB6172|nr:cation diffusion facilitator family transporter [Methanomethylovorans sp. PtaU1.Bin093]OPY22265.1 MAG: ferrous iron efflux protein F [Methanomethylovorans sp. PtaU1.Bin093]